MSRCKDKSCPSEKICNPASGRCIQKDGKLAIKLFKTHKKASRKKSQTHKKASRKKSQTHKKASRKKSHSRKLSNSKFSMSVSSSRGKSLDKTYGSRIKQFIKNYYNIKKLGKGAFGAVYLGTKSNGKKEVIKIQHIQNINDFNHEYNMGKKFGNLEISPKMISKHTFDHYQDDKNYLEYGIYKMGLIDGTLDNLLNKNSTKELIDYIFNEIMNLLSYMCKYNLIHGDFHPGNIGYLVREDKEGNVYTKFQVIDHGYACCIRKKNLCEPDLEVTQLIRCMKTTNLTTEMQIYFTQKLLDFYMLNYNTTKSFIPKNFKIKSYKDLNMVITKCSKKYIDLHNIYLKSIFDPDVFN